MSMVVLRAFFADIGRALAGLVVALVYNVIAGMLGGVRLNIN